MSGTPLLEVVELRKWFASKKSSLFGKKVFIKAVDGVSFTIEEGETLGVVGESGCGKSTLGKSILRLLEPTSGQVRFYGTDFLQLKKEELRKTRSQFQMIFQDPYASLNPRMTVFDIIAEPLVNQGVTNREEQRKKVLDTMGLVGINPKYLNRYPHEFSGGQRQRIGIARAIVLRPKLIVCDEPVSALDVSIQAQVINLLKELQHQMQLAYVFISHDLSVIKHISDRVMVMYLGHVVEIATKEELFLKPFHPYTNALISAIPAPGKEGSKKKIILKGDLPSPANPPSGCVFHTRCYKAQDICKKDVPELQQMTTGHFCRCHFSENNEA